jgi:hypothetical protein
VRNVRIGTDWSSAPPVLIWKRAIGPGWSSFAVQGDLLYTQEQRGNEEVVAAYSVATGKPVWAHRDAVRFYESNGGAGPRGTPTLSGNRVYAFGATGILNALDARTGARLWSSNVARDTSTKVPGWGFSSSPIVAEGVVVVAAAGNLAGYDAGHRQAAMDGPAARRQLQLATARHDRWRQSGRDDELGRDHERGACDGRGAVGLRVGRRRNRAAGGSA